MPGAVALRSRQQCQRPLPRHNTGHTQRRPHRSAAEPGTRVWLCLQPTDILVLTLRRWQRRRRINRRTAAIVDQGTIAVGTEARTRLVQHHRRSLRRFEACLIAKLELPDGTACTTGRRIIHAQTQNAATDAGHADRRLDLHSIRALGRRTANETHNPARHAASQLRRSPLGVVDELIDHQRRTRADGETGTVHQQHLHHALGVGLEALVAQHVVAQSHHPRCRRTEVTLGIRRDRRRSAHFLGRGRRHRKQQARNYRYR